MGHAPQVPVQGRGGAATLCTFNNFLKLHFPQICISGFYISQSESHKHKYAQGRKEKMQEILYKKTPCKISRKWLCYLTSLRMCLCFIRMDT